MSPRLAQVFGHGVGQYAEFAGYRFSVVALQKESEYLLLPRRKLLNVGFTHSPDICPKARMSATGRKRTFGRTLKWRNATG
jgi:hypothetical protein